MEKIMSDEILEDPIDAKKDEPIKFYIFPSEWNKLFSRLYQAQTGLTALNLQNNLEVNQAIAFFDDQKNDKLSLDAIKEVLLKEARPLDDPAYANELGDGLTQDELYLKAFSQDPKFRDEEFTNRLKEFVDSLYDLREAVPNILFVRGYDKLSEQGKKELNQIRELINVEANDFDDLQYAGDTEFEKIVDLENAKELSSEFKAKFKDEQVLFTMYDLDCANDLKEQFEQTITNALHADLDLQKVNQEQAKSLKR